MLKIGDFGMASEWPAPADVEGEGDRRYMGPDSLEGQFNKPADIFALGMMMLEIASNCEPPDNGESWQKLRCGDFSGLPSLTYSSNYSMSRDSRDDLMLSPTPEQLDDATSHGSLFGSSLPMSKGPDFNSCEFFEGPPAFMLDPEDDESLDHVVHWMMTPQPRARPIVDQILLISSVKWVNARRRAGAAIFEGNWGPPNHVLDSDQDGDEEMLDAPCSGGY